MSVDPHRPHDLLGRALAAGDYVAYPVAGLSSSIGMTVAEIDSIVFRRHWTRAEHDAAHQVGRYLDGYKRHVPAHEADNWTLSVRPLRSTGYYFRPTEHGRCSTVQKVENVVKVDAAHVAFDLS